MNIITKRTVAFAISAAALATAVTPSFAQTRVERPATWQMQMQERHASQQAHWGRYAQYRAPGHMASNQCLTDEGNGRFSSCTDGTR